MSARMPIAYAQWELRDAARGPGLIILAIAVLAGFIMTRLPAAQTFTTEGAVRAIANQSLFPLVLVVTAGMVSRDLNEGYYRAYFSRPVSPSLFYLQRWLVGGAVLLLFIPLLAGAASIRTGELAVPVWIVGRAALLYLLLGGTVLLLSTVTRRDWVVAAVLYIMEQILHSVQAGGGRLGAVARAIYTILPPYHVASIDGTPTPGEIWTASAYGAGLVLAALAVLHWRALGSGGRA
jgi:ABC-type transport system involved in multi-copper enzyme maturation permease subunit